MPAAAAAAAAITAAITSPCHAWPMTPTTDDDKYRRRVHDNDTRSHDAHDHAHNYHTGRVVLGPALRRRAEEASCRGS